MTPPIWLILTPLLIGFGLLFIDLYLPQLRRWVIIGGVLWMLGLAVSLLKRALVEPIVYNLSSWPAWLGINLIVDPFSAVLAVIIAGLGTAAVFFSFRYLQENQRKYYSLLFFLLAGMMGMVLTGDLFNLFVFIEVTSLAAYALVAFEQKIISFKASFKYVVIGSISGFLVLLGIILIYQTTGTLNLAVLVERSSAIPPLMQKLILSLFIVGLGAKFAVVPLHTWLPAAHPAAPSPISALLSGVVIKVFGYSLLRLISVLYLKSVVVPFKLDLILTYLGIVTLLTGHLMAYQQNHLKQLLAYSTIAQVGYILIGIGAFSFGGLEGAVLHIVNHALVKASLFLTAGIFIHKLEIKEIAELKGVGYKLPAASFLFTVGSIAIIGLPPFNCFISKWLIANAALEQNFLLPAGSILLGSILALVYYLRVITIMYTKEETEDYQVVKKDYLEAIPLLLVTCCLLLGIFPDWALQIIDQVPKFILQPANYHRILLGG